MKNYKKAGIARMLFSLVIGVSTAANAGPFAEHEAKCNATIGQLNAIGITLNDFQCKEAAQAHIYWRVSDLPDEKFQQVKELCDKSKPYKKYTYNSSNTVACYYTSGF